MDTQNLILLIKTDDFYGNNADDVGNWCDTKNYHNKKGPLNVEQKQKCNQLYESGKIITKFATKVPKK